MTSSSSSSLKEAILNAIDQVGRQPKNIRSAIKNNAEFSSVTIKQIQDILDNLASHQVTAPAPKVKHYFPVSLANHPFERIQIDLMDLIQYNLPRNHYRYLFVAIDVFSRFGFVYPLNSKEAPGLRKALEQIIRVIKTKLKGFTPARIDADSEAGWSTASFGKEFPSLRVVNKSAGERGTEIVERFILTIRKRIQQQHLNRGLSYNNIINDEGLASLLKNYNQSPNKHTAIGGRSPEQAVILGWNKDKTFFKEREKTRDKAVQKAKRDSTQAEHIPLKVGDLVRRKVHKTNHQKRSITLSWSEKVYRVVNVKQSGRIQITDGERILITPRYNLKKIPSSKETNGQTELEETLNTEEGRRKKRKVIKQLTVSKNPKVDKPYAAFVNEQDAEEQLSRVTREKGEKQAKIRIQPGRNAREASLQHGYEEWAEGINKKKRKRRE